MKILIVNENLDLGGAERGSVELANALSQRNIKIYFASSPGVLLKKLNPNIKFFELPRFKTSLAWRIIKSLSKIILDIKPDIVHSQGATLAILSGIAIKKTKNKSINILTRHTRKFHRIPRFLAIYLLNKYCNHIITISPSAKNDLIKTGIKRKISLIPFFVDFDSINNVVQSINSKLVYQKTGIPKNSYIITIVSRLIAEKRIDKFIKILACCSKILNKNLVGLIIGKGPCEQELKKFALKYSGQAKILFLGYQEDIFQYLAISDIFLFPSEHQEVLPAVLTEALAAGVPVICSNIPGNNEIVQHGYDGFVLNYKIKNYVKYIRKILKNKNLHLEFSKNAQKSVQDNFGKKDIINKIISLYKNLCYKNL